MDEMKSAFERALERAEQMGKLSPEEMQKRNEAKYRPVGEAIATRFFEHGYASILCEQLDKLGDEAKLIATQSALSELIGQISIEDRSTTERALDGISALGESDRIQSIAEEIVALFGQYAWQKKLWYEENSEYISKEVEVRLAKMGISGNAIGDVNIENDDRWAVESGKLLTEYRAMLEQCQQRLTQELGIA